MAFDEGLAQRLREHFDDRQDVVEKKMFGGLCFMVRGNMCCGIIKEELMLRVGKDRYEALLTRPHAREMDFTKRSLKGFLYVATEGFEEDDDLRSWVAEALAFNETLPAK